MLLELRDYQQDAVQRAEDFFRSASRGDRLLFSAPTGTGKSVVELALLTGDRYIVTPRLEIVAGMLEKLGVEVPASDEKIAQAGQERGIWTPIRLRNKLVRGEVPQPSGLVFDEVHHAEADSWGELIALSGNPPCVGFTASPFRGTPRGTSALRKEWGEPVLLITLRDAVRRGYCALPTCRIVPLVDDDIIKVTSTGEFDVRSATETCASRVGEVVKMIGGFWDGTTYDRPTMLAVPSTEAVGLFVDALRAAGYSACGITADSSRADRQSGFRDCIGRQTALVQINVVSEGVDLPIRRLVDMKPMLSPVAWVQQFGRITRPGGESEYICCNRNLLRHAYLLEGLLPVAVIKENGGFEKASSRAAVRAIGFEAVGRFKAAELPFLGGITGHMYCLSTCEGTKVTEYAILTHPLHPTAFCAKRIRSAGQFGPKWEPLDRIPEIDAGFSSLPASPMSEKQAAWWKRSAAHYGLDPDAKVTRKSFAALPVLANCGVKFNV